ncbi:hypothetical protein BDK51DRAFT_41324 [Blyttiomyces helicus]|uniref:DNA/RNA-binding domain-containing protein n=1 Tax=Blyttiomyces helicus TaxID=388810 RepID=A0A4P9W3F1_9FUNG|nr:hypothetical protein BDK51DRAFT_41324 [Blyttiomyces helicus]|eukprot:RKO86654.1 hypothetical protein BDK51DRAFT_41324 [Blyttiomyces helicus]
MPSSRIIAALPHGLELTPPPPRLRDQYEAILLSRDDSLETESSLWKVVHYRVIEEFRRRLKESTAGSRRVLSASYRAFLNSAISFYVAFVEKMAARSGLERVWRLVVRRIGVAPGLEARYREIQSERREKTYALTTTFYNLALRLVPDSGNPYNQLAVVSVYQGDFFRALERYYRSLMVENPFPTAFENLILVSQKARKWAAAGAVEESGEGESGEVASFSKGFVTLVGWVVGKELSLPTFETTKPAVLTTLRTLLTRPNLPPDLPQQLLTIAVGAHYLSRALPTPNRKTPDPPTPPAVEVALRAFAQDIAAAVFDAVVANPVLLLPAAKLAARWLLARARDPEDMGHGAVWEALARALAGLLATRRRAAASGERRMREDIEFAVFLPFRVEGGGMEDMAGEEKDVDQEEDLDEEEEDGEVEDGAANIGIRVAQIVEMGMRLCDVENPRLFVTMTKTGPKFASARPALPPLPGTSSVPACVVPPTVASHRDTQSDDEDDDAEDVVVFAGRQRRRPTTIAPPARTAATTLPAHPPARTPWPVHTGSDRGLPTPLSHEIRNPFSANPITTSHPVSIPPSPSSAAAHIGAPSSFDSGCGAGPDAVDTMAFLGLGSPAGGGGARVAAGAAFGGRTDGWEDRR